MRFNNVVFSIFCIVLGVSCNQSGDESKPFSRGGSNIVIPELEVMAQDVILRPNEGLVYYNDLPFTGYVVSCYDTGQLSERISFYKGKKHGLREQWFADGKPKLKRSYKSGQHDGESISWWQNGNMRTKGYYVNGKVHGTFTQWYQEGMIFKEMNYRNGKAEGMQKAWRKNGKLYNNYEAKNGRIFGLKRANLCYELQDEKL